jgi:hypothetical protein
MGCKYKGRRPGYEYKEKKHMTDSRTDTTAVDGQADPQVKGASGTDETRMTVG